MKNNWFYIKTHGKHDVFNVMPTEKSKVFFGNDLQVKEEVKNLMYPFVFSLYIYELRDNGEIMEREDLLIDKK